MDKSDKQKSIRIIGIYLVLVLALIRFLVYPLYGVASRQKAVFAEESDAYRLKQGLLARQMNQPSIKAKPLIDKTAISSYLYEKKKSLSYIQAEVLESLINGAQKSGLTILNFELPEAVMGKEMSEAPVLIRVSGKPEALIGLIRMIGGQRPILTLKSIEFTRRDDEVLNLSVTLSAFRMER
jgi:Tfp pilus assembly protein PilO